MFPNLSGMAEASAGSMDEALQGLGRGVKVADIFHYLKFKIP